MVHLRLMVWACLFAGPLTSFAVAQSVPAGVGEIDSNVGSRVLENAVPQAPDANRAPLPDRSAPDQNTRLDPEVAALTLRLSDVVVTGNSVFPTSDFAGLWAELLGSEVTIGQLAKVADDIQTFYRREGYVFTRVILLQDGFKQDVATIRVVEGVLGEINVEESAEPVGPVLDLLKRMAAQLEGVRSPHISDLERVLLTMNDVPGIVRATAVPRRATSGEPGQVNITINVERKALGGVVFADNRQAPSAGRGLVGAVGEYASYSSAADTTQVTFLNSFWRDFGDLEERRIFQIEHSRHVTASGLVVSLRGLYSQTELGDELEAFEIAGDTYEIEVAATYPLIRTRPTSVNLNLSFELSSNETDVLDGQVPLTDDQVRTLSFSIDTLDRDSTGFLAAELGVSKGFTFLGGSEKGDANLSRADGDPSGLVVFGSLERDQQIYGGLTANMFFDAQWASTEQLASGEYQAGGTTIGRGYDPSELTGDHGYGAALELRYTQPLEVIGIPTLADSTVQIYGFYDYARVFNIGTGTPKRAEIASFGGGLRLDLPRDIRLELEIAKPLEELQRNNEDDFRVFFEAQARF